MVQKHTETILNHITIKNHIIIIKPLLSNYHVVSLKILQKHTGTVLTHITITITVKLPYCTIKMGQKHTICLL